MDSISRLLTQTFSALLRLYPASFRQEFGEEMKTDFSDQIKSHAASGSIHLAEICFRELLDLFVNLFREHLVEFGRRTGIGKIFRGESHSNLIALGMLAFGISAGLRSGIGLLTGLSTLEFTKYTLLDILVSLFLGILFTGIPTWVLWQGSGNRAQRWGFMPPVIGASFVGTLTLLISIIFMPKFPIYNQTGWFFWGIGWPLISTTLRGLLFSGWFGYVYQGRDAIWRFAAAGTLGRVLAFILWLGSNILMYRVLGGELVYYSGNPWFMLWDLTLTVIGGMIFGALLGWQASKSEIRDSGSGIVA